MQQEKLIISGSPKSFAWFVHGYTEGKSADVCPVRFIVSFPTALSNLGDADSVLIHIVQGRYLPLEENEVIGFIRGISVPGNRTLLRFDYKKEFKNEWVNIWNEVRVELESQGWEFYDEESTQRPSKKTWKSDKQIYRLVKAKRGVTTRDEHPDMTWKEIIVDVGFQLGGTIESRLRIFQNARKELEQLINEGNQEMLAEIDRRGREEEEEKE